MFSARSKGQSTLEYVILIGFVVSALIAMGVYMKRGIQGKLRESTDQVGEQYSAHNFTSEYNTDTVMYQKEKIEKIIAEKKMRTTTNIIDNYQAKTGNETIRGFGEGNEE